MGRPTKYLYAATKKGTVGLSGIVKMDLESKQVLNTLFYGDNKFGGEPTFVPKQNGTSEDDGYLLTFVHDEVENQSSFWIINSKTIEIVAIVNLPQRVPWGFHGLFVSEEEILSQLKI